MASNFYVGQRLSYDGVPCTVRYIGPVEGTKGDWVGVEWDYLDRGKHDGEHKGVRYFTTRSHSKTTGSFVRPTRNPDPVQSFVEAVRQKYASEAIERRDALVQEKEIEISGKVVEEVGFDKIRAQLAQLHDLKIVLVDGMRIVKAETEDRNIRDVCPKIVELDLSRNLFQTCAEVIQICGELDNLKSLRLNGNRLSIERQGLEVLQSQKSFSGINDLSLDEMLIGWDETCLLAYQFKDLSTLSACLNQFSTLPAQVPSSLLPQGLKTLKLEFNGFTSLVDLLPLVGLKCLEKLHLKGNTIKTISDGKTKEYPRFGHQLHYVDLSYNEINDWSFVDQLPDVFPGITGLRFSHNPIYESAIKPGDAATSFDEGYMLTLARIANLKSLNYSHITHVERSNAEMFYLSRIGKAMAAVPEAEERRITSQHKRYDELCEIYGAPVVVRAEKAINPDLLEARLIKFTFYMPPKMLPGQASEVTKVQEIPRGFDMYRLKGIVGRLFGIKPLSLRLIWETGEWDPVAGYEDKEEDSDEDEDDENEEAEGDANDDAVSDTLESKGKWMRREVELEDGTRQVGFCVDGMQAKVRVELR